MVSAKSAKSTSFHQPSRMDVMPKVATHTRNLMRVDSVLIAKSIPIHLQTVRHVVLNAMLTTRLSKIMVIVKLAVFTFILTLTIFREVASNLYAIKTTNTNT